MTAIEDKRKELRFNIDEKFGRVVDECKWELKGFNLGVKMGKEEAQKEFLNKIEELILKNGFELTCGFCFNWKEDLEELKQSLSNDSPRSQLVHEGSTPSNGDARKGKEKA